MVALSLEDDAKLEDYVQADSIKVSKRFKKNDRIPSVSYVQLLGSKKQSVNNINNLNEGKPYPHTKSKSGISHQQIINIQTKASFPQKKTVVAVDNKKSSDTTQFKAILTKSKSN
jgi:hypothetical protein